MTYLSLNSIRLSQSIWLCIIFFFFSSRRRHTRCLSDWSSDVCSSDLVSSGVPFRCAIRKDRKCDSHCNSERAGLQDPFIEVHRSEERRVGKECRSRGWLED